MDRGKWAVLYTGVSASGEETPEGREDLAQNGPSFGEKGDSGLCPDIRVSSPHLIPQVSSYTVVAETQSVVQGGRARPEAGGSNGRRKLADLSERYLRRSFLKTREIRFLRDINR
jgi:hypothetical protein